MVTCTLSKFYKIPTMLVLVGLALTASRKGFVPTVGWTAK
jgi:hypothetical protein